MNNNNNKLSVKSDIVFKRIFAHQGNEEFLKQFLSALLKLEIKNIQIMHDIHLEKNVEKDKLGIIDVKAQLDDNVIINIEVQMQNEHNIIPRSTFYSSKLISNQLVAKEEYQNIKPVIVICILNYICFPYEEDYINETVMVLKNHKDYEVNDLQKYYYIELEKFRKLKLDTEDITSQWLTFIDSENSKELDVIMKKNDTIKKANEELEYLEGDEEFKRIVELREKYDRDLSSAKADGKRIGKEEGIEIGKEEGIEIGKKEGIEIGNKNKAIEIAKNLLKKNMSLEDISEVAGLTKEEIEKLK